MLPVSAAAVEDATAALRADLAAAVEERDRLQREHAKTLARIGEAWRTVSRRAIIVGCNCSDCNERRARMAEARALLDALPSAPVIDEAAPPMYPVKYPPAIRDKSPEIDFTDGWNDADVAQSGTKPKCPAGGTVSARPSMTISATPGADKDNP